MKLFASVSLVFLLGAMFVSLFSMSMGTNMIGEMSDCPFMSHDEVWCPMDLAEHLGAWHTTFLAIVPIVTLLAAVAGTVFLFITTPHLFTKKLLYTQIPSCSFFERRRFIYYFLRGLFSNGILNPKLY